MRISDWISDVCSSDLLGVEPFVIAPGFWARINPLAMGPLGHEWEKLSAEEAQRRTTIIFKRWLVLIRGLVGSMKLDEQRRVPFGPDESEIGRASSRGKSVTVRGTLEGRRNIKK